MGGSSSHRRRSRNRSHRAANCRPAPHTTHTQTYDHLQITTGPGYNLLIKHGWRPGQPLRQPSSQSPASFRSTPIPILVKRGRGGIGFNSHSPSSVTAADALAVRLQRVSLFDAGLQDPLRPRCQFDHAHVVRDIKALRKHELTCPANPHRRSRDGMSPMSPVAAVLDVEEGRTLDFASEEEEEEEEEGKEEDVNSILSDMSDCDVAEEHMDDLSEDDLSEDAQSWDECSEDNEYPTRNHVLY